MSEPGEAPPEGKLEELAFDLEDAGAAFRFCPACASPRLRSERGRRWTCPDCGFEYFHNVATAAGIIVDVDGRILLLERARDPRRGRLALPGGFVEPGERAEDAALRECREETGWAPETLEFLASYPNLYLYRGIPYATCDLFFVARAPGLDLAGMDPDPGETGAMRLVECSRVEREDIAFPSTWRAIESFGRKRAMLSQVSSAKGKA